MTLKNTVNDSPMPSLECITADWPAPDHVRAFTTTRKCGVSDGSYASFNLASHVGDQLSAVNRNRERLRATFELPAEPCWLKQTHSNDVIDVSRFDRTEADASWAASKGTVCAVLTADCLPVFFSNKNGSRVAIAHAGWRGLLNGVISATFTAMQIRPTDCLVWLGPSIGPDAFEVGGEVLQSFSDKNKATLPSFRQKDEEHWFCDMYQLARVELEQLGIKQVFGGGLCTYTDKENFYSFRRDGDTGRMASLIWITD
jgi:YfiH family protein